MVSAYSTIANDGVYLQPRMVTRIEDSKGEVLAEFGSASPERALSADADRTLLDTMRDVVNRGTGSGIRTRFGIRADVAGKTGTTQDNADGWFILMDQQLVAGAWVGFDDGRVTLNSDYWGQGAHSALPIVGDFFQRALRSRIVDPRARFDTEVTPGAFEQFRDRLKTWMDSLFASKQPEAPRPVTPIKRAPAPEPGEVPPSSGVAAASSSVSASAAAAAAASDAAAASAILNGVTPPGQSMPPILGPSGASQQSAPSSQQPPYPSQEPSLAPTPTPDDADSSGGAPAQYTPPQNN
jgi:penicillin-binding protein 1A